MATLLAALAWMVFFYRHDQGRPEPPLRVAGAFVLGALAVLPTIAWEGWALPKLDQADPLGQWAAAFLVIGVGEEAFKFAAAYLAAYRLGREAVRLPVDAIIYAIAAGLGFAAVENIIYARTFGPEVLALRTVVGFIVHASFAGVFGYFVGVSLTQGRTLAEGAVWGIAAAALLHGLYDYAILTQWIGPGGVILAVGGLYALLAGRIGAARRVPA